MRVLLISILALSFSYGVAIRIKRDDFLSDLGKSLNTMLGSLFGQGPNSPPRGQQQPYVSPTIEQRNPPMPIYSQQIQQNPIQQQNPAQQQSLPMLGTNSAYDRRVSEMNSRRSKPQRPPVDQWSAQQGPGQQGSPVDKPIRIIDQQGKLSYCNDNAADCMYLSCLAENFQRSEQANNLKMAGQVFLDRKLRRAVANDPLISQAACDKVGLDEQGCNGFRQLLGIVDKFDFGPSDEELSRDPETHGSRNIRSKVPDYDHVDVNMNPRSNARANSNRPDQNSNRPGQNPANGRAKSNGRQNPVPNQSRTGPASHPDYTDFYENGASASRSGPGPGARPNRPNANGSKRQKAPDYTDFYENGGSASRGQNGGQAPAEQQAYKPKDCKAIVRNAKTRG